MLAVSLLVLDYVLVAPNFLGTFFFGKITIVLYWFLQMFFLGGPRIAYRYFRYTPHAPAGDVGGIELRRCVLGRAADADVLLRAIESGAVKKIWPVGILSPSPADRGQTMRGVPVLGDLDDLERVGRRFRRRAGAPVARLVLTPSALEPEVHAGNDPDEGAPARPHDQPAAVARRRRRGAAAGAGQRRGPAAAAEREDRLPAAGRVS